MIAVLQQLMGALEAAKPVAVCQLIATRGSTPQKAGAVMLVFPDGSQVGTVGGGCVEAEVNRRALAILQKGVAEIVNFDLDYDYGWDNGLICGGRMVMLIDPLLPADDHDYYQRLDWVVRSRRGATQAIVFDREPAGLPTATLLLFDDQGSLAAVRPPGAADHVAISNISPRPLADRPRPYAERGVAYLPIPARCRLLIVGGGHVGQAVAELAADVDFDVWVVDDRENFVSQERFPKAEARIAGPIEPTLRDIEVTPETYVLIVTRGHHHDQRAVYHLAQRGARYVGLIGSRRKIRMIFEDLATDGISAESLAEVFAPVGIDIGSQTVREIAVSIVAELIAHRNCNGRVPGRPGKVILSREHE